MGASLARYIYIYIIHKNIYIYIYIYIYIISTIVGTKKPPSKLPDTFIQNDNIITEPNEIANSFNTYFSDIGNNLADKIEQTNDSPLNHIKTNNNYIPLSSIHGWSH